MTALLLSPTILSLLLLAAHFSRAGLMPFTVVSLLLIGLVFVRSRWSSWILQGVLLMGAAEWVRTIAMLAAARQAAGQPSGRLVVILSVVVVLALSAALSYRSWRLRGYFSPKRPG